MENRMIRDHELGFLLIKRTKKSNNSKIIKQRLERRLDSTKKWEKGELEQFIHSF